ncbi:MAG: tetratricopeptide repeat protein [Simkaniaceae bacterium]|nr:tetratricopeptide repeat protein [Candidatus Sacchlamyda saccharinae]
MIVKNESKVIERCLESVKPFIDYWVIVDTGSTDGTQNVILKYMEDVPGELHERSWVDFAHNRTEALHLAKKKGDYLLCIDADEELIPEEGFSLPNLEFDWYFWQIKSSGTHWHKAHLIKNSLDWKWVGVLHEYLDAVTKTRGYLDGITTVAHPEGCRSQDPKKYTKDAEVLEKALKKEPNNARYMFYLAQSYKDAGDYRRAIEKYQKRVEMGGWAEEVFWSLYQVAYLKELLQKSSEEVIKAYCDAFHYRPTRAEPLCRLAMYLRAQGNYAMAYAIADLGTSIKVPNDILMVEEWAYDYRLSMEKAIGAYWVGKYEEANNLALSLLNNSKFPKEMHEVAENVIWWAQPKIFQSAVVSQ